jgi:hypothetical protein
MQMPTKADVFPSKYLKAEDLKGHSVVLKIATSSLEKLKNGSGGEQRKVVLTFLKTEKQLPLNATNFDSVMDITGEDDSDNWVGHKIELYPTQTTMQGKSVDCIRIRAPGAAPARAAPVPALAPAVPADMDDEIPF